MNTTDEDRENELGGLSTLLSPIMSTPGVDTDKVLASGDPQAYLAAVRSGSVPQDLTGKADVVQNTVSQLAQGAPSLVPATNAPNPPSEVTRTAAVPSTVTPTGTASTTGGANWSSRAGAAQPIDMNAVESNLVRLESPQSAENPQGMPMPKDPLHPEYRPSVGRRILRGVLGGLEGLAKGGAPGALIGTLDPAKTTGVAYGAPTSRFQRAQQMNAALQAPLKQELQQAPLTAEAQLHQAQAEVAGGTYITPEIAAATGLPMGTVVDRKDVERAIANKNTVSGRLQGVETTVQGRKDVAAMNDETRRDIADANNLAKEDIAKLKPEQRDDRAIRIMSKPATDRTQEENAYLGGYAR
jgi:hypothetical protein